MEYISRETETKGKICSILNEDPQKKHQCCRNPKSLNQSFLQDVILWRSSWLNENVSIQRQQLKQFFCLAKRGPPNNCETEAKLYQNDRTGRVCEILFYWLSGISSNQLRVELQNIYLRLVIEYYFYPFCHNFNLLTIIKKYPTFSLSDFISIHRILIQFLSILSYSTTTTMFQLNFLSNIFTIRFYLKEFHFNPFLPNFISHFYYQIIFQQTVFLSF